MRMTFEYSFVVKSRLTFRHRSSRRILLKGKDLPLNSALRTPHSIHSYRRSRVQLMERPYAAHAVPRISYIWRCALAFIALHEAGHKELFSERGQLHATCA